MNFELKDPELNSAPHKMDVFIGGKRRGEVEPSDIGGGIDWHASLKIGTALHPSCGLVQGFGKTPREAIADSIVRGRNESNAFAEALANLEKSIGTSGQTAEAIVELAKAMAETEAVSHG